MADDVYSVFGNKVRVQLIRCLQRKSKNVTELISTCRLSQSAVSQHLAKLKNARIVKTEKIGKEIYYSLRYPVAAEIAEKIAHLETEAA